MENSKIAMGAGMFLLVAIGAFLIIPMSQEKTLILTTRDESNPVSCLDDGQLILAQNLTDLCDVVIISPSTNQTLVYNGTYWVNMDTIIFNDTSTCQNIGNGSAFICVEGTNIDFRSILASTGLSVSNNSNTITLTNTSPESTVCSGQSGNYNIVASSSGGNCTFKNLVAGTSISISSNSTHIIITNSKPEQGCSSAGGTSIWKTTTTCDAKGLTAGVGLTLTSNTNDNNYKTNFANGTGVTITGTTTQTFNSQCANTGTGEAVCESSNNINSLIAGNGFSITDTTGDLTLQPRYELLCQSILGSSASTISCSSFTARTNLFISLQTEPTGGTTLHAVRFNSDSGNNYASRRSSDGAADSTATSVAQLSIIGSASSVQQMSNCEIKNITGLEKLVHCENVSQSTAGAATAPSRTEFIGKWANTTNQITTITIINNGGTGSFNTGSSLTVWGYD